MQNAEGPSSRRLDLLPEPTELSRRCQALALLEAGLNSNPSTRWHNVTSADGVRVCRVSDGSGNEALHWFNGEDAVVRGFDHESPISPWAQEPMALWPGMYEGAPSFVSSAPTIEVAGVESVTFCFWWADGAWRRGPVEFPPSVHADPDGSEYILKPIASIDEATDFLSSYYERPVRRQVVAAVFEDRSIDEGLLAEIALQSSLSDMIAEAIRMGYTVERGRSETTRRRRWFRG